MYGRDYSGTLHGRSDGGSIPIAQDDDLAARVVAALMETSELVWVRHQMELDARAQEQEEVLAASFSEPKGTTRRHHIPSDTSGSGQWQDQVEESGEEPSGLQRHEIGEARSLRDRNRPVRHRDFAREPSGFSGAEPSPSGEEEMEEEHHQRPMRARHSRERSFHHYAPDPDSGLPRVHLTGEFEGRGAVAQRQPQLGSVIESNRESILTAVKNGSMTIEEGKAAMAQLSKYRRDKEEFDAAIQRQFGPAQSQIDLSVRGAPATLSQPFEEGEADVLSNEFATRALEMDAKGRAEQKAAHTQWRRYAKREQPKQYVAPDWLYGQSVINNKQAALIAAKAALERGGDAAYAQIITEMSKVPA
jgi:hypothetical protein